jgi:hypothetical protein
LAGVIGSSQRRPSHAEAAVLVVIVAACRRQPERARAEQRYQPIGGPIPKQ